MATRLARLLAVLTLAALTLLPTPAAQATSAATCDQLVVDHANILDDSEIINKALAVQAQAADVRVVSYDRVPGGNLDKHMVTELNRCVSWQGVDDGWKNNLIVLAVSVDDRTSGLYYAETFDNQLDQSWPRIQADEMNPAFARGDFTGGMVSALAGVADAIDPSAVAPYEPAPYPGPQGEPVGDAEPIDVPVWVWTVPLGLAGLGAGTAAGVYTRRRLRTRASARTAAVAAADTTDARFMALDAAVKFTQARVETLPQVDDTVLVDVRARFVDVNARATTALNSYLAAADTYPTDTLATLDADAAEVATAALTKVADELATSAEALAQVDSGLDAYDKLATEVPAQVAEVRAVAAAAETLLRARTGEGFQVDVLRERLTVVDEALTAVEQFATQARHGDAAARCADALTEAQTVRTTAADLPARFQRLRDDLEALREDTVRCRNLLTDATTVTDNLEAAWHATCTDGIRGHVDRAAATLAQLPAAIEDLDRCSSMTAQDFDAADTAAETGRRLVDDIESAGRRPADRLSELQRLVAEIPGRLGDAESDLAGLAESVTQNAAAVTYLDRPVDLDSPAAALAAVRAELDLDRPRWLWARDTVAEVARITRIGHDWVTDIVAGYAEAERLTHAARAEVSDARAEVARPHAGQRAQSLLGDAIRLLADAEAAATLAARSSKARAAADRARDAAAEAQQSIRAHRVHTTSSGASGSFGSSVSRGRSSGGRVGGGSGGSRSSSRPRGGSSSFGGRRGGFKGGSSKF